ncbi:MAG: hypothetical protein M3R23_03790 [Actinomycetota bacterium]|nr:hypothetical protein [Actinomycetota bacterium]
MGRLRRRLTYANVVSTIALVLAVGGGAVYAASKIGAQGIRKNAIHSFHIKNKQVKRQDIAGGSINSRKVSNESLTGKDIKEATLGLVPSAQDARTVNGITERVVRASQADSSGATQIVGQGGLAVLLVCTGGNAVMQVHGSAPGDAGTVFEPNSGTQQFDSATTQSATTNSAATGFTTVRRLDGTITRFEYELDRDDNGFGTADDCFLHGFLLSGR